MSCGSMSDVTGALQGPCSRHATGQIPKLCGSLAADECDHPAGSARIPGDQVRDDIEKAGLRESAVDSRKATLFKPAFTVLEQELEVDCSNAEKLTQARRTRAPVSLFLALSNALTKLPLPTVTGITAP